MTDMTDYITLHASEYPPTTWTFHANRPSKEPSTYNNELWTEMTNRYDQSMAKRRHLVTSNFLSKTATTNNIRMMGRKVKKICYQRQLIALEDTACVLRIQKTAKTFVTAVDELARNPMETIQEEDGLGATHSQRQPTRKEMLQIKQAIRNTRDYETLQESDDLEGSFRARLEDIYSVHHSFICTPVGKHPRPRWAQICRMDKEVTSHVAQLCHLQQQSASDATKLREFLRVQLFDEYCLMRGTPAEKKDKTWLEYGDCLVLGQKTGKCKQIR